jgi:hypothetical protein
LLLGRKRQLAISSIKREVKYRPVNLALSAGLESQLSAISDGILVDLVEILSGTSVSAKSIV